MESLRTLVVDDEDDMRTLVTAVITAENAGLSVIGEASGGQEALERVGELDPDAVVLDQRMPGMTGIETAEALRSARPDVRVVLFSAFIDEVILEQARAAGVDHVVSKSNIPGLIAALRASA